MDGWCSGALVKLEHDSFGQEIKFKGFNYNPKFTIDELIEKYQDCDTIYIVDYSFGVSDLQKLLKSGFNVIWCDHHKTAIEEYAKSGLFSSKKYSENIITLSLNGYEHQFYGFISEKYSGAKIVYEALKKNIKGNHKVISEIVELISIHDIWDINNPNWDKSVNFNSGASLYNLMPWKEEWTDLFSDENVLNGIIEEGDVVARYKQMENEKKMLGYGGVLNWEGYTWLCINDNGNSMLADTIFDPKLHDAILYFKYKPSAKLWKLSFFNSSKKQVGGMNTIAEKCGLGRSGGHDGAAGCMVEKLPFNLEDIQPLENY